MTKIATSKNRILIRSHVRTVIKKATMFISVPSQKTYYSFNNFYVVTTSLQADISALALRVLKQVFYIWFQVQF